MGLTVRILIWCLLSRGPAADAAAANLFVSDMFCCWSFDEETGTLLPYCLQTSRVAHVGTLPCENNICQCGGPVPKGGLNM